MDSCLLPAYRCAIEALYIFIGSVVHLSAWTYMSEKLCPPWPSPPLVTLGSVSTATRGRKILSNWPQCISNNDLRVTQNVP